MISVGKCLKSHGIKGGFALSSAQTSEDTCLQPGKKILLRPLTKNSSLPAGGEEYTIQDVRLVPKGILYLQGIEDRNGVEGLIPFEIFVARSTFGVLEENEYFLSDFVGLAVYNADEPSSLIGEMISAIENHGQVLLKVKGKDKYQNELWELPFTDGFFPKFEIKAKKIWIKIPEYL
jgi:16S rRNA processing protein RimM